MSRRRGLLLALLVYVTLDLSLPAMPGAFVFEPDDSVESITRARESATAVAPPLIDRSAPPAGLTVSVVPAPPVPERLRLVPRVHHAVPAPARRRSAPPVAEDPH